MIKRILALRYVCKKYNLTYQLKLLGDVGWIDLNNRVLCVALFQKHFYETLYHEIGHLVADRSLRFQTKYVRANWKSTMTFCGDDVFVRLQEEATASKFAFRFLKVKDKKFLKRCWYGYTSWVAKNMSHAETDKFVTTVAKYNKYFDAGK